MMKKKYIKKKKKVYIKKIKSKWSFIKVKHVLLLASK